MESHSNVVNNANTLRDGARKKEVNTGGFHKSQSFHVPSARSREEKRELSRKFVWHRFKIVAATSDEYWNNLLAFDKFIWKAKQMPAWFTAPAFEKHFLSACCPVAWRNDVRVRWKLFHPPFISMRGWGWVGTHHKGILLRLSGK